MRLRELTEADVEVKVTIEPEDEPVKDHFCSEDPDLDREMESTIAKRLRKGDTWAWCTAFVEVSWKGYSSRQNIGCCSYDDEADFRRDGYFPDMVKEGIAELNRDLQAAADELSELEYCPPGAVRAGTAFLVGGPED